MSESNEGFEDVFWTAKIEEVPTPFDGIAFLKRQADFLSKRTNGAVTGSIQVWNLEKQHIKEPAKTEARQPYFAVVAEAFSLQPPKMVVGPLDEQVAVVNKALGESKDPLPIIHVALEIASPYLPGYSHSLINLEYIKTRFLAVIRSSTVGFYQVCYTHDEFIDAMKQLLGSPKMDLVINAVAQRAFEERDSATKSLPEEDLERGQTEPVAVEEGEAGQ